MFENMNPIVWGVWFTATFLVLMKAVSLLGRRFRRKREALRFQHARARNAAYVLNAVGQHLPKDFSEGLPADLRGWDLSPNVLEWDARYVDLVSKGIVRELITRAEAAHWAFNAQECIRAEGRTLIGQKGRLSYREALGLKNRAIEADGKADKCKKSFWDLQNAAQEMGFTTFGEIKYYLLIDPATIG